MQLAPKRIATIGGTLFCALGIGFVMQNATKNAASENAQPAVMPAIEPVEVNGLLDVSDPEIQLGQAVTKDGEGFEISDITLTSAEPVKPTVAPQPELLSNEELTLAAMDSATADDLVTKDLPAAESEPSLSCEYELKASPAAGAMVDLEIMAPCMTNERFTLHHSGMMFTETTDHNGYRKFTAPALIENAVFIVSFGNGAGAIANAQVSAVEYYDRVVVQWEGDTGLQIHALEYGAHYGDDGHIWADAAGDLSNATQGMSGFLASYGAADADGALLAEVYSFPSGLAARDGQIALSVEAEVTLANCNRDIEAEVLQISNAGSISVQELQLAMPECNAVGDFLVLKNLLNNLKIASN